MILDDMMTPSVAFPPPERTASVYHQEMSQNRKHVFQIINILIIIRVALSWFNYNAHNQYVRLLYKITEPILAPIRNVISSFNMGIDISPLIAIFALSFIRNFSIRLLLQS